MGTTVDTVERRLQEEILRRDALMLANVKQSIVCTDLNGIVTYWNSGATELYGWTADEMIGRPFYSRMATEEMRAHARMRMKTAATVGEFRHEREDFRKDGTRIFVDSRVFAIRDPEGRITGVIGMASDITARRQAELDRLQLERQLLQAQKMETIGTLASGVAHEFNNILAVIIGNIELAEMIDPEDRTYREHHDIVLRCSRRARDLVQRMLSFSRAHDLERRPVQLALVVAEAAKLIRVTLPESVDLQLDPAPAVPDILIDVNQFQQLAMNLAANAGYAMREKGGRLVFRTRMAAFAVPHACAHVTLPAGSYVALDVSDEAALSALLERIRAQGPP